MSKPTFSGDLIKTIPHGLYRIHWKKSAGGGKSIASVGSNASGWRWFAPCNWTSGSALLCNHIHNIKKVVLIKQHDYNT